MQKKPNISTAMWFIPLLAILLACVFVGIYWMGRAFFRSTTSTKNVASKNHSQQTSSTAGAQLPIVPSLPTETEEEPSVPQEVLDLNESQADVPSQTAADICPSTTVATKIKKPSRKVSYTPYEKGLRQCKKNHIFPCAWEDKKANRIKQYWLMGADGPITRGIYDINGNLVSETTATMNGTVISRTDNNVTWYFEGGMLVKIRTSPYDNCNYNDWFFIRDDGAQDVCQCAYATQDCCARSPYKEGMERSYCGIFPQDKDFCK